MIKKYLTLASRIRQELLDIKDSINRAKKAWGKAIDTSDSLYLDSVALNLHDFYTGIERVFELIAENIDESKPDGRNWHKELIEQMAIEIPQVRPAVISQDLKQKLDEYRGFRHIVRNIYAHNLKYDRIKRLIDNVEEVFNDIETKVNIFCAFLEQID